MTTATMEIGQAELEFVKEAARRFANAVPAVDDLVEQWVEIIKPLARNSGWTSWGAFCATRLIEAYRRVYPELEEAGWIDAWGGSESRSVMCALALSFADTANRDAYVRTAMEACWEMG